MPNRISGRDRQSIAAVSRVAVSKYRQSHGEKPVPEEVPIAFSYSGTTHAVMMASPSDLDDFAFGFSLSEGIIQTPKDISNLEIVSVDLGTDIQIELSDACAKSFSKQRSYRAGPVGCGLCGAESIDDVLKQLPRLGGDFILAHEDVYRAIQQLSDQQVLRSETGAVHAASFYDPKQGLVLTREDIGRHNALDKVIGALTRNNKNTKVGALVITSRVSVDMVQKAALCGAPVLIAVSTPTALSIRMADRAGITLIALARDDYFEIYTHPHRIIDSRISRNDDED